MRRVLIAAAILPLLLGTASAGDDLSGRGHLVLIGGGSKPPAAMERFVELAGGRDAPIVVFPTASGEPDTPEVYRELLAGTYGCTDVWVAPVRSVEDAHDPEVVARVGAAGGIFFSGGDQRRILEALGGTPTLDALRKAFARGAAVGGTSAGTACQSPLMITGDGDFSRITADNVELWPGLGLFDGVIVDQHFVARSRHNRLISVVLEHPDLLGVGVDEATAVWVRPDDTFEVVGEGWVVVYDARPASVRRRPYPPGGTALGAVGITVHVLLPGDRFDLRARRVVEAAR